MGLGRDSMSIFALLQGKGVVADGVRYKLADLDAVIFSDTGIEWDHTYSLIDRVTKACNKAGVPFFNLQKPPDQEQFAFMRIWRKGVDQVPAWRKVRYFRGDRPTLAEMQRKAAVGGYHEWVDLDRAAGLYGRTTGKNTASCTERHKIIPVEEVLNDLLVMKYGITLNRWGIMASRGEVAPNVLMIGIAADETKRMRIWAPPALQPRKIQRSLGAKRSIPLLTWAVKKVYPLVEMGISKADEQKILDKGDWIVSKSGCFSCHFQPSSWFWSLRLAEPESFQRVVDYEAKAIARQRRERAPRVWSLRGEDLRKGGRTIAEVTESWGAKPNGLNSQVARGNLSWPLMEAIRKLDPAWPSRGHRFSPDDLPHILQVRLAQELMSKGYNRNCAAMDRNVRGDLNRLRPYLLLPKPGGRRDMRRPDRGGRGRGVHRVSAAKWAKYNERVYSQDLRALFGSKRPYQLDDEERELWILNDGTLWDLWRASRIPDLTAFVDEYRDEIDAIMGRLAEPESPIRGAFSYNKIGRLNKRFFGVTSPAQGLKVIKDSAITENWRKSLRWKPKHKTAVLLPCAATKPFPDAPSHKAGYLDAIGNKKVDLFVVSEPLGIVPYSWSRTWPNDSYDFPPEHLQGAAFDLLAERMGKWFDSVGKKYDRIYLALPAHHSRLIRAAMKGKKLPVVDVGISACLKADKCAPGEYRSTTHAYREYLRGKVRGSRA
ncbi:hypothetical protein CMI47_03010 [Candidatus Pacearchaeota archaeon]|nr:hypothetical protein [Candidatus Pacearchaeota archaeon]